MSTAGNQLDIPFEALKRARDIFQTAQQEGALRGRNSLGLMAASLYVACRQMGLARHGREVAGACGVDPTILNRNYRLLRAGLSSDVPPSDPVAFLSRLSQKLLIPERTTEMAKHLLKEAQLRGDLMGKNPTGLAAAAIFAASILTGLFLVQKDVAEAAGVTIVTLRAGLKSLHIT
jgi:transcription initiation factor TFIIB